MKKQQVQHTVSLFVSSDGIGSDRRDGSMEQDFAFLLRDYRKRMGWTQAELAERWNYSFETISAWERCKRTPSRSEFPHLTQLLAIDEHELFACVSRGRVRRQREQQQIEERVCIADTENVPCQTTPFIDGQLLWSLHLSLGADGFQCVITRPLADGEMWEVVLDPQQDFEDIQQVYQLVNEQVCKKARQKQGTRKIVPFERVAL